MSTDSERPQFSPNYLRTIALLLRLATVTETAHPINGQPLVRDAIQSVKFMWLIGEERRLQF